MQRNFLLRTIPLEPLIYSPLKILFPSVYYLPQAVGGIEFYIQNLAQGLMKKGYEVKVSIPTFTDAANHSYEYEGTSVLTYRGYLNKDKASLTGLYPNEALHNFKEILRSEQPDIVHFNQLTNSNGISVHHMEAARQTGARIVCTNHLSDFICQRGNFMYMGHESCDGIIKVKKCTACLMNMEGYSQAMSLFLSHADDMLIKLTGEKNYRRQIEPLVFPGFHTRWHLQKIKKMIELSDAFVSLAEWMNTLIKLNNLHQKNCYTIQTGLLHTEKLVQPVENRYDGKRPLKIIYVGRIMPLKATHVLIDAAKKIDPHLIEVHIYGPTSGEGAHRDYCDSCIESARQHPNIIFHGKADNRQMINLMADHDLLCLPSRGEMAPLVIQEAMAAGIPVAGSDLPAIKEWVTDGYNGFIFPKDDPGILSSKLLQIIQNPELLQHFKKRLPKPGDFNEMTESYHRLYQSLLTHHQ